MEPDALVAAAQLGGNVSFAVADAKTGQMLEMRNGSLLQPPASVTKTVTAAYALETSAPDIASGPVLLPPVR